MSSTDNTMDTPIWKKKQSAQTYLSRDNIHYRTWSYNDDTFCNVKIVLWAFRPLYQEASPGELTKVLSGEVAHKFILTYKHNSNKNEYAYVWIWPIFSMQRQPHTNKRLHDIKTWFIKSSEAECLVIYVWMSYIK